MIDDDQRQQTALFRFGVIADLVQLAPGTPGIYRLMAVKADREYRIPGSSRTRIAMDTIRDWLGLYRAGGFEALLPKPRCDAGRPRALPDALVESLLAIKEQHRDYSVREVIRQARALGHVPTGIALPPSLVHRLFARHGLMQKAPEDPSSNDRRHFQFEKAGDLWMSDVMHGPAVTVAGKRKAKAYLIAFLDDATRIIPFAAFALTENTETFLGVFKQALMRRGLPTRLYFEAKRKVQKDRTVSLDGVLYEIDAALVNETILLRYDPGGRRGQPLKVWCKGRLIHEAKPVDAYANCFVKRNRPSQNPQPSAVAAVPEVATIAPPTPLPGLRLADINNTSS